MVESFFIKAEVFKTTLFKQISWEFHDAYCQLPTINYFFIIGQFNTMKILNVLYEQNV